MENFKIKKFVDKEFNSSMIYIKESRKFIYAIVFIFAIFAIAGYFIPLPGQLSLQIIDYFRNLIEKTEGLGGFEMSIFIFGNNSVSGFMGLFLGVFFGVFPIFSAIANGFVLGFVANLAVSSEGIFSLWRLFPHGVFELPAIFVSFGLGVKLSTFIFEKNKLDALRILLRKSVSSYVFVVLPLLVIAAVIEGTLIVFGI